MKKLHSYLKSALLVSIMVCIISPLTVQAAAFPYGNSTAVGNSGTAQAPGLGISAGLESLEAKIDEGNSGIIKEDSLKTLVNDWTSFFLQYYMVVAVGLVIYLGVRLVLSQGSEEERGKTKQAFLNLAIGTAIIFLSYVIVNQVVSIVSPDAGTQTQAQIRANSRTPGTTSPSSTTP